MVGWGGGGVLFSAWREQAGEPAGGAGGGNQKSDAELPGNLVAEKKQLGGTTCAGLGSRPGPCLFQGGVGGKLMRKEGEMEEKEWGRKGG